MKRTSSAADNPRDSRRKLIYVKSVSEIPDSGSDDEVAAWYQTHSTVLIQDQLETVPAKAGSKLRVVGQFAVAAVSDRRKLLINKNRRSETAATAEKMYHYQAARAIDFGPKQNVPCAQAPPPSIGGIVSAELSSRSPALETVEWPLAEAVEVAKSLDDHRENLRAHKRGSEAYWEALAGIAVAAELLRAKLDTLVRATDAPEDGLPDD